jgi:hypothetical protein
MVPQREKFEGEREVERGLRETRTKREVLERGWEVVHWLIEMGTKREVSEERRGNQLGERMCNQIVKKRVRRGAYQLAD